MIGLNKWLGMIQQLTGHGGLTKEWRVWVFTSDTKQGTQMPNRKSDGCVVPMKSGNSDGGKTTAIISSLLRKHLLHTEVDN